MKLSGAKILVESLRKEGVDVMFGYPGGVVLPTFDALYDAPIRFILVRHEQAAAHAADGYARATGKVGVCLATSGPGATNLITGIATALAAFCLINTAKNDSPVKKKYLFLPVLLFFGTGANDSLMKLSGVYYPGRDEIQFLTVTFLTAFAIGSIILLFRLLNRRLKTNWNDIWAGALLGVLNWFSTYFGRNNNK